MDILNIAYWIKLVCLFYLSLQYLDSIEFWDL